MPEDNNITRYNLSQLISRFPDFEPSYETLSHKKVPEQYDFAMAIPTGKKSYLWYTFYKGGDGVFLIDMNKDGRVLKCTKLNSNNFVFTFFVIILEFGFKKHFFSKNKMYSSS